MAKKAKLIPNILNNSSNEDSLEEQFFQLLRAVANGDEAARKTLGTMLDVIDFGRDFPPTPSKADNDPSAPDEITPITLSCPHVRELHLRIKLNRTERKIWREIKVPSNLTLTALGEVLQDAMGWMHEHLFQFRKGDIFFVSKEYLEDTYGLGRITYKDMDECTIDDMLTEKGKRVVFEYDYGDSWEHDLWHKGEREYAPGEKPTITFVKGQGACPPEDCGGIWGYEDLLEIRKKKKLTREEHESLEWYCMDGDFNPDFCDDEEIDEMMQEWTERLQYYL